MKKKIILIATICVFVAAAIIGVSGILESKEIAFAEFLNPGGEKNTVMLFFTHLGAAKCVIPITAVFLLLPKRRQIGLPIAVTVILSWLTNTAIKNIVRRPRPIQMLLEEHSFSFPSGHAMNNAALYFSITICLLPFCKKSWQKAVAFIPSALPFVIGITRVYFNVHYISDVVAGWSLGLILALLCCSIILEKGNFCGKRNKIQDKLQ